MSKNTSTNGKLYLLRERDYFTKKLQPYVKIGIVRGDKETADRIAEHQTGNPRGIIELVSLESPMAEALETQLHYVFGDYWISGEWFLLDDTMVDHVVDKANKIIKEQTNLIPFMEKVDKFEGQLSNGKLKSATDEHIKTHQELKEADQKIKILGSKIEIIETEILQNMLGHSGVEGVVNLQFKTTHAKLDKTYLKKNYPNEYSSFCSLVNKWSATFSLKNLMPLAEIDSYLNDMVKQLIRPKFDASYKNYTLLKRDKKTEKQHFELIALEKERKELEWQKYQKSIQLKAEVEDYLGIDGLCTWERKATVVEEFKDKDFLKSYPALAAHQTKAKESASVIFRPYRAYPFKLT